MSRQGVPLLEIYEKSDNGVLWSLFQYVSPMGRLAIDDWRKGLSATRRASFDVFFRNLVKLPKWKYPDIDSLKGKHLSGFYELRWKSERVPHRVGGYFAAPDEFVILIGWTHNEKKYDPPEALGMLPKRKRQIETEEATIYGFTVAAGR